MHYLEVGCVRKDGLVAMYWALVVGHEPEDTASTKPVSTMHLRMLVKESWWPRKQGVSTQGGCRVSTE